MSVVEIVLAVYVWTGLLFAVAFAARGAARIDPAVKGSSFGFRILIVPAAMALWPWLLAKWVKA